MDLLNIINWDSWAWWAHLNWVINVWSAVYYAYLCANMGGKSCVFTSFISTFGIQSRSPITWFKLVLIDLISVVLIGSHASKSAKLWHALMSTFSPSPPPLGRCSLHLWTWRGIEGLTIWKGVFTNHLHHLFSKKPAPLVTHSKYWTIGYVGSWREWL